jgi:hypothetical protein
MQRNTKKCQEEKYEMWRGMKPSIGKTSQLENAIEDAFGFHFQ